MRLKGRTLDIALQPVLATDVPDFNRVMPVAGDMRNVRYDDLLVPRKRPGYSQKWDLGVDEPVRVLIPENTGYAMDRLGQLYVLGDSTVTQIYELSPITDRPTWIKYNDEIILCSGVAPIAINGSLVSLIGNNVPHAKWVVLINDFAVYLGYHDTEFISSVQGNPKNVDTSFGARTYTIQKSGSMLYAIDYRENLLIFKEREIEVWSFRGGDPPFVRQPGAKINKGIKAPDSVVKGGDDRVYWFADDGDFYVMDGFSVANISAKMDITYSDKWQGFNITKENLIMWINIESGDTVIYDYRRDRWLLDNRLENSAYEALPFCSYMELNGKQYFGSARYDGLIHEWSYDYKEDNGEPIRVKRLFTVPLSRSGFMARVNRLNFRRLSNLGDYVFMVRIRFDKLNWSEYEHITLDGDEPNAIIAPVGLGREMDIEIIETDPVDFLISNIYATVERLQS